MEVKKSVMKKGKDVIMKKVNKRISLKGNNGKTELYEDLIDENFLNFIKKQEEDDIWSKCQTKSFLQKYKLKKYKYPNSTSNKQISTFYKNIKKKREHHFNLNRLLILLTYFVSYNYASFIIQIIKSNPDVSDREIVELIRKAPKNDKIPGIYGKNENNNEKLNENLIHCPERVYEFEVIYKHFRSLFKKTYEISFDLTFIKTSNYRYLDIGCGNGNKTELFGDIFHFPKNMIYGTDIENWGPYSSSKKFDFHFKYILQNGKLDFPDNYFGLITCFFTLHHIPNLTNMLEEMKRVLIPNGYIIIIEHDVIDEFDGLLIDIQHLMYSYLRDYYKNPKNYKNYITQPDFNRYFNVIEWDYIFMKHNFEYQYANSLQSKMIYNPSFDNQFYCIYKNVKI